MRGQNARRKTRISGEMQKSYNVRKKKSKKRVKKFEVYFALLLISTLFMSIGYAQISDTELNVSGITEAEVQDGVFISDIINLNSDTSTNESESSIKYFLASAVKSEIVLGKDTNSYISYKVSMYNNTDVDQVFIETLTDKNNKDYYDNTNIEFDLSEIEEYKTVLAPKSSIDFTITFKYAAGADVNENVLNSILNFRFQPLPRLLLDNDGQTYELKDIYPDYTPQEYTFKVSNYDGEKVNAVPMTYKLITNISSPLTAKIYNENGDLIDTDITIEGDGITKIDHTYTLKIIWDGAASNDYNDPKYEGESNSCTLDLVAVPTSDKYLNYSIEKGFDVDIKMGTFDFIPSLENTELVIKDGKTNLNVTLKNYLTSSEYNKYDVEYEFVFEGNSKFTMTVNDSNNGVLKGNVANTNTVSLNLTANMNELDIAENATLKIKTKKPYISEEEYELTIKLHKVTVTLNPGYGTVSTSSFVTYGNRTYDGLVDPYWKSHVFDGWYTSKTGGTKIEKTTEVTTDASNQTLYAHWTSLLLADNVQIGDYVNYPITYSNVASRSDGTQIADASYDGWRVVGIGGEENNRYVKLITEGVPMAYKHPTTTSDTSAGATSVKNLTTGFFNTKLNTKQTDNQFYLCGFKTETGGNISSMTALKTLFTNDYTQVNSSGVPAVQSVTKSDMDTALGFTTENVSDVRGLLNNLFSIPATSASQSGTYKYAGFYLATAEQKYYLWNSYYSGYIVYTSNINGVRPVVTLKTTLEHDGKVNGVWQMKIVD